MDEEQEEEMKTFIAKKPANVDKNRFQEFVPGTQAIDVLYKLLFANLLKTTELPFHKRLKNHKTSVSTIFLKLCRQYLITRKYVTSGGVHLRCLALW